MRSGARSPGAIKTQRCSASLQHTRRPGTRGSWIELISAHARTLSKLCTTPSPCRRLRCSLVTLQLWHHGTSSTVGPGGCDGRVLGWTEGPGSQSTIKTAGTFASINRASISKYQAAAAAK